MVGQHVILAHPDNCIHQWIVCTRGHAAAAIHVSCGRSRAFILEPIPFIFYNKVAYAPRTDPIENGLNLTTSSPFRGPKYPPNPQKFHVFSNSSLFINCGPALGVCFTVVVLCLPPMGKIYWFCTVIPLSVRPSLCRPSVTL